MFSTNDKNTKIYLRLSFLNKLEIIMEFKCGQCSKSYTIKMYLTNHARMKHGNPKQFQCKYCEYLTPHKGHLETHIRSQHENIKELCSGCGKQFSNQSNVYQIISNHIKSYQIISAYTQS